MDLVQDRGPITSCCKDGNESSDSLMAELLYIQGVNDIDCQKNQLKDNI